MLSWCSDIRDNIFQEYNAETLSAPSSTSCGSYKRKLCSLKIHCSLGWETFDRCYWCGQRRSVTCRWHYGYCPHHLSMALQNFLELASGSGRAAADAVHEHINSLKCESMVIGMCFDTTASNTGKLNGACTLLEKAMGRNLLWMACRYHMFEVLLADVFNVCLGPSTGQEILFFKSFFDVPVENWSDTPSFQVAAVFVRNLVCINDFAERGVALVQHFNETITKNAEQKNFCFK
ncbi:hypothetical protein HELRODRAFT_181161 [Helobdella robusta]|uniref:Uncharacterized protein n=1 Tax=Helobdella robusta TaxID=6412 RepID=T1FGP2_HELRO|nr:hypothetical protein HELRODRAFT_181161 [Helobdella robusta]ESN93227.1 hypothetical protein HELRODRAFT_181161 [Helobdella robusta]